MTDFYARLREAADRHRSLAAPGSWDLTPAEFRVMSQNGEDGVLCALFDVIAPTSRTFVEFGASDGIEGTCAFLAQVLRWSGLFIEAGEDAHARLADRYAHRDDIVVTQAAVTPDNIAGLFDAAGVPDEPDVVSIDIDGNDLFVLAALPRRPRVLVVEYNGSLPRDPSVRLHQPHSEAGWDGTDYFGASLGALEEVARRLGYRLVHTELAGVNAFFVRSDIVLPDGLDPPRRPANYDLRGGAHRPDPSGRPFLELGEG